MRQYLKWISLNSLYFFKIKITSIYLNPYLIEVSANRAIKP